MVFREALRRVPGPSALPRCSYLPRRYFPRVPRWVFSTERTIVHAEENCNRLPRPKTAGLHSSSGQNSSLAPIWIVRGELTSPVQVPKFVLLMSLLKAKFEPWLFTLEAGKK